MLVNLERQLQNLRESPEFGALSVVAKARIRVKVMERVMKRANSNSEQEVDILAAFRNSWNQFSLVSLARPVAILVVFSMILGGSMSGLMAALNAMPGDALYGLKRASEQARLSLAKGPAEEARLHVEFVDRRAEEVVKVLESSDPVRAEQAVSGLKKEIKTVTNKLSKLRDSHDKEAVSVARLVDSKVASLEKTIDGSLARVSEKLKVEVQEIKNDVVIASTQALSVMADSQLSAGGFKSPLEEQATRSLSTAARSYQDALALSVRANVGNKDTEQYQKIRQELLTAQATLELARKFWNQREFVASVVQAEAVVAAAQKAIVNFNYLMEANKEASKTSRQEFVEPDGVVTFEESPATKL